MTTKYLIDDRGRYIGAFGEGVELPEGVEVDCPPDNADQPWLFPGWGGSPSALKAVEEEWRAKQEISIESQLDALEEADAGAEPTDLQPGTRAQWLQYRGQVRNWKEGAAHYPDPGNRPVRPT